MSYLPPRRRVLASARYRLLERTPLGHALPKLAQALTRVTQRHAR
jgi:hypothetical protein